MYHASFYNFCYQLSLVSSQLKSTLFSYEYRFLTAKMKVTQTCQVYPSKIPLKNLPIISCNEIWKSSFLYHHRLKIIWHTNIVTHTPPQGKKITLTLPVCSCWGAPPIISILFGDRKWPAPTAYPVQKQHSMKYKGFQVLLSVHLIFCTTTNIKWFYFWFTQTPRYMKAAWKCLEMPKHVFYWGDPISPIRFFFACY